MCAVLKNSMIEIVPAVLPHSLEELQSGLERLKGISPFVQIDLVGKNVLEGEEAPPLWEEFDFEFDLMTHDSLADARRAIDLGASRVVVHSDFPNAKEALESLQQTRTGDYPVLVGVALPSTASLEILVPFEGFYDYVQVMGIEHVGSQGQPFDPRSVELVAALRAAYPDLAIQVDGAAAGHAKELADAGATRLIVGSAIMDAEDPRTVYKELYTKVNADRGKS